MLLVLFLFISSVTSLYLHTNTKIISLTSHYSSIGTYPSSPQIFNYTIFSKETMDGCTFKQNQSSISLSTTIIKDQILVFSGSIPKFITCNTDTHANIVTLARLSMNEGALGLIIVQPDKVYYIL